jgi:hypothetical protein
MLPCQAAAGRNLEAWAAAWGAIFSDQKKLMPVFNFPCNNQKRATAS